MLIGDNTQAVLEDLYYEAAWLGTAVARHQLGDIQKAAFGIDWSKWKPGDPSAARLLLEDVSSPGLKGLLAKARVTIKGINDTRLSRLGTVLRNALERGDSGDATAKAIQAELGSTEAWADVVARTETRRAVTASSVDYYREASLEQKEWLTSGSAVDECLEFEGMGPIPLDADWDGNDGPPAHPNCLCVVMPVIPKSVVGTLLKAGRNVIGDALDALAALPDVEPGRLAVPWPVMNRPKLKDEVWADSTIEAVDIDSLYASQDTIARERVEFYIKHPGSIEENRRAFANVYVVEVGGSPRNVIVDGHHRLAALWLLGANLANVWYLEEGA